MAGLVAMRWALKTFICGASQLRRKQDASWRAEECSNTTTRSRQPHLKYHQRARIQEQLKRPLTRQGFSRILNPPPRWLTKDTWSEMRKGLQGKRQCKWITNIPCSPDLLAFQTKMEHWVQHHHPVFLDESLHCDGLGDVHGSLGLYSDCLSHPAQFRCKDCLKGTLRCSACIVSFHQDFPLHRVQVCWISCTTLT